MGQPPLSQPELEALPEVAILDVGGKYLRAEGNFTNMSGERSEQAMLLGVVCSFQGNSVFVKMTGPRDTVAANEDPFLAFCASLR